MRLAAFRNRKADHPKSLANLRVWMFCHEYKCQGWRLALVMGQVREGTVVALQRRGMKQKQQFCVLHYIPNFAH